MTDPEAVARLREALGIRSGYHDIWGNHHAISADTERALVAAMGIDLTGAQDPWRTLDDCETRSWRRSLPAVAVARDGDPVQLPLCLPADHDQTLLRWIVTEEDGREHRGELRPADLPGCEVRTVGGVSMHRRILALPVMLPPGYHRVRVPASHGIAEASTRLIVAPRRCYCPPALAAGARVWGIALQLYGLRSRRNWGIGDLGDLAEAMRILAALGADLVGINPLHALYPSDPGRASPYSPSSRLFSNPLYLDVEAMTDFAECDAVRAEVAAAGFQARLAGLRASELVDYAGVAAAKLPLLERLFAHFREQHLDAGGERAAAFRQYQSDGYPALRRHAAFEALQAHFARRSPSRLDPSAWPEAYRDLGHEAVAAFCAEHAARVELHEYLQWQLSLQLEAIAICAAELGMVIGLYRDLAVGSDGRGADVWADPSAYAVHASIGAPPDDFSPQGQVWGLAPWRPEYLHETAYQPFIDCVQANMRHAGALRVDHVVGLMRQFWVPAGRAAGEGAYVGYPFDDLLAILALESERNRCLVIGEDLGTVPDAARAALHEHGTLSYRVLYFEKHWHGDGTFKQPHEYPEQALVTASTHDLPTLAGFWTGRDLQLRRELGSFGDAHGQAQHEGARAEDRMRLLGSLHGQGLAMEPTPELLSNAPPQALRVAIHRYLARSPAAVMSVQLEDVVGELEQANLPGTVAQQPNWQRKLALALDDWREHGPLRDLAAALNSERGRGAR